MYIYKYINKYKYINEKLCIFIYLYIYVGGCHVCRSFFRVCVKIWTILVMQFCALEHHRRATHLRVDLC